MEQDKSWIEAELEDNFDEELEMEIDDERIARELKSITDHPTNRRSTAASTSTSCSASRPSWSRCRTGYSTPATSWW